MPTPSQVASYIAVLKLRQEHPVSLVAQELFAALNADISRVYPDEITHHSRLGVEEFIEDGASLFLAYRTEQPVSGGGGRKLLRSNKADWGNRAVGRLVPEPGEDQISALALYRRAEVRLVPGVGEHTETQSSVCLETDICP